MTFAKCYDRKNNGFDLIRYFFAILVIYYHCYPLLGISSGEILQKWSRNHMSLGSFAVNGFFIIGGFLITQSMDHSSSLGEFLKKRVLRIFPAFMCSLLICAFIIGPICSALPMNEYIEDAGDGPLSFIIKNLTFNVRGYAWGIHDVFSDNPYPLSVNGSMWTLKHEFACYLVILILACLKFFEHRKLFICALASTMILYCFNQMSGFIPFSLDKISQILISVNAGEYATFIGFLALFLSGACIYIFADSIPLHRRYVVISWLIFLLGIRTNMGWHNIAVQLFLPYAVLGTCVYIKNISVRRFGDLSYGLYIYSFPIQQTIIHFTEARLSLPVFFTVSLFCAVVLAIISWNCIEKFALRRRG